MSLTFNFTLYPFNFKLELMKRSFTVTELLVAIAIVVILAGILIGGMGYAGRRADDAKTIAAIQTLSAALEAFRAEKGYFPPCTTAQDVMFYRNSGDLYLVLGSTEYKFVDKTGKAFLELNDLSSGATTKDAAEAYKDAWGMPIRYHSPGIHNKAIFDLWSKGRDKVDGGDDDIANWDNASQQ